MTPSHREELAARYDRLAEAFPSRGEGWRIAARILRRVDASERVTSRLVAEPPDGTPRERTAERENVSRDGDHARRDCADRAEMRGSVSRVVTHGWGLW